jgi:hypothetical protein
MKKIFVAVLLLFFIIQMGCSSTEINTPSTTSSPIATQTYSATLTPTLDFMQETVSAYQATNWAPVYATLESRAVKCADGYYLEVPEIINRLSTDKWSIFTCSPQYINSSTIGTLDVVDYGKRYTKILSTDFSHSWIIYYNDFSWSNRLNAFLIARFWSQDGNFVYLIPATSPSASGFPPRSYFIDGSTLYRLNLNSGKFEIVLPYLNSGYAYSLSPNGEYLAYTISSEKKVIYIRNSNNGDEHQITLDGDYVLTGSFAWKTNGLEIIFAAALNGWDNHEAGTSIFMLSIPKMQLQPLVYNDARLLVPVDNCDKRMCWSDENTIHLTSLNESENYFLDDFTLNIQSGNIVALPTPTLPPTITPISTP